MTFATLYVLPDAGDAQQRLVPEAVPNALHQLVDRLRLVARGLVVGFQYKRLGFHGLRSSLCCGWRDWIA